MIPSTMATMTSRRTRAIRVTSRWAKLLGASAAGEATFAARTRSVGQLVVREDRLLVLREQFAVRADRRRFLDLLLVVGDLQITWTDRRAAQGNEDQPVPGRQADRDRR